MPHRGSGDRGLCQSYDDSQSGSMGFTSNLLNWLKTVVVVFVVVFYFLSQLYRELGSENPSTPLQRVT